MTSRAKRVALVVIGGSVCLAAALAADRSATTTAPAEAQEFVIQHEILAASADGKFHPERRVRRGELAEALYRTVEAMVRDERLRGPVGPEGPPGPQGAAASDTDIARAIARFTFEIDNDLSDIRDDIADLQDSTDSLERRVARLEAALKAVQDTIGQLGTGRPAPGPAPTP